MVHVFQCTLLVRLPVCSKSWALQNGGRETRRWSLTLSCCLVQTPWLQAYFSFEMCEGAAACWPVSEQVDSLTLWCTTLTCSDHLEPGLLYRRNLCSNTGGRKWHKIPINSLLKNNTHDWCGGYKGPESLTEWDCLLLYCQGWSKLKHCTVYVYDKIYDANRAQQWDMTYLW